MLFRSQTCVWLYNPQTSKVAKRPVTLDRLVGSENAMISSGIANNDMIVVAGVNYITEGQTVKVLK